MATFNGTECLFQQIHVATEMSTDPQSDEYGQSSTLDDRLDIELDDDDDTGAPAGPGLDQLVTSTSTAMAVVMLAVVATVIGSMMRSGVLGEKRRHN